MLSIFVLNPRDLLTPAAREAGEGDVFHILPGALGIFLL